MLSLFVVPLAAAQPLYGADSPIIPLDKKAWTEMQSDFAHVWVVEYYADWCGHCKAFAPKYEKAAAGLAGLVKFGGVNADSAKGVMRDVGVTSYPTIKVYLPELSTNPYTGKRGKVALNYEGARTAKALAEFVSAQVPTLVVPVPDGVALRAFALTGAAHLDGAPDAAHAKRALLLSAKSETALLAKALALRLRGRLALGEAQAQRLGADGADGATELVRRFGVRALPALVLIPAARAADGASDESDGGAAELYEGELKYAPLWDFLERAAGPDPAPAARDEPAARAARALSEVVTGVDDALYEAEIASDKGAWVLAFERGSTTAGADDGVEPARVPALARLAAQLRGQAAVGLVNASETAGAAFAERMGVREFPALRVLPYGEAGKAPGAALASADAAAARKAAGESLPASAVRTIADTEVDTLLQTALQQGEVLATCVLFTEKASPPPLFRALALHFERAFAFAMVPGASPAALARFQLSKLPSLLCLWAEGAPAADGQLTMQGAKYDDDAGPLAFAPLGMFLANLAEQRGGPGWADKRAPAREGDAPGRGAFGGGGGDAAPAVRELTAANFAALCGDGAAVGLCAIALLDGDRAAQLTAPREAQLRTLAGLALRRRGDPSVGLFWLDATCYDELPPAFDVSDADLPTMVVFSPAKQRFAKLHGTFTVEGMARFLTGVVSGRVSTQSLGALPHLDAARDCETTLRGAAKAAMLAGDEADDTDDTVAEILAEEAERRRALEAELEAAGVAAAGVAAAAGAGKRGEGAAGAAGSAAGGGERSAELRRLEAELEECGMHDLLCSARRDKQLAAIEKRRALDERLAEIAAKNKAKKRKKRKGAGAN
ncbi:hypothetical protein KFE25_008303 [Diacronema lutheri]|uniref:Thioredoxin domain-containing protein n=1 Tax=Diacronema lutheri TaxID=2081491 RepID=A0A8J5XUT3_DIALT|nr:hypothetical protein KFE25_008303 [Diacronema lutheri]